MRAERTIVRRSVSVVDGTLEVPVHAMISVVIDGETEWSGRCPGTAFIWLSEDESASLEVTAPGSAPERVRLEACGAGSMSAAAILVRRILAAGLILVATIKLVSGRDPGHWPEVGVFYGAAALEAVSAVAVLVARFRLAALAVVIVASSAAAAAAALRGHSCACLGRHLPLNPQAAVVLAAAGGSLAFMALVLELAAAEQPVDLVRSGRAAPRTWQAGGPGGV
jgi:hypothetical protein